MNNHHLTISGKIVTPRGLRPSPYSRPMGMSPYSRPMGSPYSRPMGMKTQKPAVACAFCGQAGHVSSKCYQNPHVGTQCTLCHKFGHSAETCFVGGAGVRVGQILADSGTVGGWSAHNQAPTHYDDDELDFVPQLGSGGGVKCRFCGRPGHVSSACFQNPNRTLSCHYCKRVGHVTSSCDANPHKASTCTKCGKLGHIAPRCTVGVK